MIEMESKITRKDLNAKYFRIIGETPDSEGCVYGNDPAKSKSMTLTQAFALIEEEGRTRTVFFKDGFSDKRAHEIFDGHGDCKGFEGPFGVKFVTELK